MNDEKHREIEIRPYDLADARFVESTGRDECLVWQPPRTLVVIGKGSDPALEVNTKHVEQDHVAVLRRATGGCAVVLSPKMVVASFVLRREYQLSSKTYFRRFNDILIHALERQGVMNLAYRGTSDIALGDRKIAGSSLYRNRHLVFFHAILNTAGGTEEMERYLKHPPRTPDYRKNRSHIEFVTSLAEQGYSLNIPQFTADIETEFAASSFAIPETVS